MDNANEQPGSSLPLSELARMDQIFARFEQAIRDAVERAGPWPRVDDFVREAPEPLRDKLRGDLHVAEAYYRRQHRDRGDQPDDNATAEMAADWRIDAESLSADRASTKGWQSADDGAPDAPYASGFRIGDRYCVEACLGEGAFGMVYRCFDELLNRTVAVKVPHRKLLNNPELYLAEARVLAGLEHPAIVRVYDYGMTEDRLCFVVSMFIEGSDLKTRIQASPLSHGQSAELAAAVAEALHYAHVHGVVHRDLKPANILIDSQLRPYLADFGLALKDEEFGEHGHGAGTPAYMSPEQARSEGHLVDGRSDIFSLGVVLYELLAARRPFRGSSTTEILERIRVHEPRPPRQIDDGIPKELERICLKALSKRATDRYNTARDMADDLRAFLAEAGGNSSSPGVPLQAEVDSRPVRSADTISASAGHLRSGSGTESEGIVKIVPKGLRSFDLGDADFFLKLLPGPHDRNGLPESIRFWKTRLEDTDPETSFRVGIIYGPSGCGKSSLVKAGLLPRLDSSIVKIYVEASGGGTEERLLRSLRRELPGMNERGGLVKVLAAVRRAQGLAPGEKLLLVIDQFEQWLHSHGGEVEAELVLALRQCDGRHVQCIVMVRDDFWLAVSRFMQSLEVRVAEGDNSRLADLFDERHARKVLAALGVAYGALPETDRTKEQEGFLDLAIAGLSDEGKVVPVRLALFAEMVKGKPWTPAALREVGGAEGVGVAFLEETFSSASAPPHHRLHQRAAQEVLAALLPEQGRDIRGHMRSRGELLAAVGGRTSPRDFDEVLTLLDRELRLVTPADVESHDDAPGPASPADGGNKYYQLTHDYLVPALRDWLTRKQKATRHGRAERRLADIASLWNAKPEGRRLPSLLEFLQIRFNTSAKAWTRGQRKMMRSAARTYGLRTLLWVIALAGIAIASIGIGSYLDRPNQLYRMVYRVRLDEVPAAIDEIDKAGCRSRLIPRFRQDFDDAEKSGDEARGLRSSLVLLRDDAGQRDFLYSRLIAIPREEADTIRSALVRRRDETDTIRGELLKREQELPASVLEGEVDATASEDASDPKNKSITERKENAATALLLINRAEKVWPFLKTARDESVRSYLIHWCPQVGVDSRIIYRRWLTEKDVGARAALLLLLGEYSKTSLSDEEQRQVVGQAASVFENEPDAGLHAAAQWLLQQWKCDAAVNAAIGRLKKDEPQRRAAGEYENRRWYVNREGQTYSIVDARQPFKMGSLPSEHGPDVSIEQQHPRQIGRHFAIAATTVTIGQFRHLRPAGPQSEAKGRNDSKASEDLPQTGMTWLEAAEYCNLLSAADRIPKDQWCYEPNQIGRFAEGMTVKKDYQTLTGYRLPTEAEWEFACRAGTITRYNVGSDEALLPDYARYRINSDRHAWPVASRMPNDLGLFDMHGNVWQWTQWPSVNYPTSGTALQNDSGEGGMVTYDRPATLRGGDYDSRPENLRAAFRYLLGPNYHEIKVGFRPARTIILQKD